MKQDKSTFCSWTFAAVVAVIIAVGLFIGPAYSQAETAVMLQQSPVQGGEINIGTGVHYFGHGSEVTLIATPRPGYRFVYWLGDVSDETSNNTTAYLDGPKIIIAVYEREDYAFLEETSFTPQGDSMSGRLISPSDYSRSGGSGAVKQKKYVRQTPEALENDPFPVPDPVPEPTTVLLLGIGGLLASRRKSKK